MSDLNLTDLVTRVEALIDAQQNQIKALQAQLVDQADVITPDERTALNSLDALVPSPTPPGPTEPSQTPIAAASPANEPVTPVPTEPAAPAEPTATATGGSATVTAV